MCTLEHVPICTLEKRIGHPLWRSWGPSNPPGWVRLKHARCCPGGPWDSQRIVGLAVVLLPFNLTQTRETPRCRKMEPAASQFYCNPTLEALRNAVSTRKEIRECTFDGYIIFSYFYTKSDTFGDSKTEYTFSFSSQNWFHCSPQLAMLLQGKQLPSTLSLSALWLPRIDGQEWPLSMELFFPIFFLQHKLFSDKDRMQRVSVFNWRADFVKTVP